MVDAHVKCSVDSYLSAPQALKRDCPTKPQKDRMSYNPHSCRHGFNDGFSRAFDLFGVCRQYPRSSPLHDVTSIAADLWIALIKFERQNAEFTEKAKAARVPASTNGTLPP